MEAGVLSGSTAGVRRNQPLTAWLTMVSGTNQSNSTWSERAPSRPPSNSFSFSGYEPPALISHEVFIQAFRKSQFPLKSVNFFFVLAIIRDKMTDLWGNRLSHNDFIHTLCEISTLVGYELSVRERMR